jgi:hypothetical protein
MQGARLGAAWNAGSAGLIKAARAGQRNTGRQGRAEQGR